MSEYPAVYRNDAGDLAIVPNQSSGPIGFYRSPDHKVAMDGSIVMLVEGDGLPPKSEAPKVDVRELVEQVGDADDEDPVEAMKGFGR